MNNILVGLEISVIGFTITMVTLLLLATILTVFTKIFTTDKNGQEKGGKALPRKVEQQVKPMAEAQVEVSPADGATLRPEIVAAVIGALQYTFTKQAPGFPVIAKIQSESSQRDIWAQASRTRLINLRQDFVSYKRGKFR